jgi:hypothetical protein
MGPFVKKEVPLLSETMTVGYIYTSPAARAGSHPSHPPRPQLSIRRNPLVVCARTISLHKIPWFSALRYRAAPTRKDCESAVVNICCITHRISDPIFDVTSRLRLPTPRTVAFDLRGCLWTNGFEIQQKSQQLGISPVAAAPFFARCSPDDISPPHRRSDSQFA